MRNHQLPHTLLILTLAATTLPACDKAKQTKPDQPAKQAPANLPPIVRHAPAKTQLLATLDTQTSGVGQTIMSELLARGQNCGELDPKTAIQSVSFVWAGPSVWRLDIRGSLAPKQAGCLLGMHTDDSGLTADGQLRLANAEPTGVALMTPDYSVAKGEANRELVASFVAASKGAEATAAIRWTPAGAPAILDVKRVGLDTLFRFHFSDESQRPKFVANLQRFFDKAPQGVSPTYELVDETNAVHVTVDEPSLAWFVRRGLVQFLNHPSGSMLPTIRVGEHLAVVREPLMLEPAAPGDIILFDFPQKSAKAYLARQPDNQKHCVQQSTLTSTTPPQFIKRVVAVAGQTVKMRENRLIVDGEEVPTKFIRKEQTGRYLFPHRAIVEETLGESTYRVQHNGRNDSFGPLEVPLGHVFVLGDNRGSSSDSRCWGTVPRDHIRGRAEAIIWPASDDGLDWHRLGEDL
ncbi:signal peptidase I [Persicimonas caeni]|uniref:Signal peptidase I n=1 Tax=Persicimonas caeni TaxID=2292766 RepID=A0A4Y6PVK4_PERCE|nr:signal peptidase I [Persicimonas caeni]QDG52338.1 signal peptidase I [Persicimonas caeni]QED33560.1 signal peptidase I [Persicimonas caeni]